MSFFSDEEFQEFEFAVGEHHTSGYDPDRVPCSQLQQRGFELVRCDNPVDGRDGGCLCTEHAIAACYWDLERAETFAEVEEICADLGKLGVDLKGRVEMGVAA